MLTLKGIYGREMYETWYKMTRDARSPASTSPRCITHRLPYTDFEDGLRRRRMRDSAGKVILDWS